MIQWQKKEKLIDFTSEKTANLTARVKARHTAHGSESASANEDKNGNIFKNPLRPAININELPWADFDIFEEELLYTPMQGRVWKAVGFETQRGCPYTCTYCNSPSNNMIYSDANAGNFHRKKTVDNLKKEMEHIIKNYQPELMYMVADTFLAMSTRELDEFSEFYQICVFA